MARRAQKEEHREAINFFIPMSDLLIGFLFIFIIIIVALALSISEESKRRAVATDLIVGQTITVDQPISNRTAWRQMVEDAKDAFLSNQGFSLNVDDDVGTVRGKINIPADLDRR